jgi:hypothetical protein
MINLCRILDPKLQYQSHLVIMNFSTFTFNLFIFYLNMLKVALPFDGLTTNIGSKSISRT